MDFTRKQCGLTARISRVAANGIGGLLAALCVSLSLATPTASAAVSVGVSIGINVPVYPRLVLVPGYPVYYAPGLGYNYFFYDGLYWVYLNDNWYESRWYDGPWVLVQPRLVPIFVLRVPVRYYVSPPPYFRAWAADAPPHWGERFGPAWQQRHRGWDHWNRASAPPPAPLPAYQQRYAGARYPHSTAQQQALHRQHYRPPKEPIAQNHAGRAPTHVAAAPPRREPGRTHAPPAPRAHPVPMQTERHAAAPPAHPPAHGQLAMRGHEAQRPELRGTLHAAAPAHHPGEEKHPNRGKGKDKDNKDN